MSRLWLRLKRYMNEARMIPHSDPHRATAGRIAGQHQNPDASAGNPQPAASKTDAAVVTKTKPSIESEKTTATATSTGETSTKSRDPDPTTSFTSGEATITTAPTFTSPSESKPTTTLPGVPNEPPSPHGSYSSGISSTDTKIAIAVPISVVGLLAIVGLIWFFLRRRRQRNARPAFNKTPSQQFPNSTSELKVHPDFVRHDPMGSFQRNVPMANVPHGQTYEPRPASMSAVSPVDSNMELGLAVAMPLNQRMSATRYGSRTVERSDLAVDTGAAEVRMPLQDHREDGDNLSVVSDLNERNDTEHGFDDLSPVSSFEDEQPGDHQGQISR